MKYTKVMKRAFTILMTLAVSSCATKSAIFELYSEKPIAVSCAQSAIEASKGINKAWVENHAIKFTGTGFSGELYHGGEGEPFTTYGIEVNNTPVFGENVRSIVDRITDSIHSKCGK